MGVNKEALRRRTDTENVVTSLIKNPVRKATQKDVKTLFNMRISERLRDDFKKLCRRYLNEKDEPKDMTTILIEYITKCVEDDKL